MIRRASLSDLPRIRELLTGANDAPYDIGRVAEEKCFSPGASGDAVASVYGDFEGMTVTCGEYLRIMAVDRARRRRGIGSALLRDAEERGAQVVAAEPGNYFTPGIVESDTRSLAFFHARGYAETARTNNLIVEPLPDAIPPEVKSGNGQVLDFIEREFGRVWRFEASRGATIFYVEDQGEIAGFSTHEANNRGLGSFGPTGVAKHHRRRGLGRQLLLASLADLRRLGYARAVIPWTEAIGYYTASSGGRVAHRFVILRKIAP